MLQPDIMNYHRALSMDTVRINSVNVRLLSCDHQPYKMPKEDPWDVIDENIKNASVVFVEYFPPELERTAFKNSFKGQEARVIASTSGISPFFGKVATLAAKHDKEIAVADIANRFAYTIYDIPIRYGSGIAAFSAGLGFGISEPGILGATAGVLGLSFLLAHLSLGVFTPAEVGLGSLRRGGYEEFVLDIIDARRLKTAQGIEQKAMKAGEESDILYIAPHAHVSRVKWYLENSHRVAVKAKRRLYSCLPGLDHYTRFYRFSSEEQTWQLANS